MWNEHDANDAPIVDGVQRLNEVQTLEKREARRLESRPNIDHLADAVVLTDGVLTFIPKVGEKVVVERVSTVTKTRPWLDTRVWVVNGIDYGSGKVNLWCEELDQNGACNFITGTQSGYRFKLVPTKGSVFARAEKRPRKEKDDEE